MKIEIKAELDIDETVYKLLTDNEEGEWFRNKVLFGKDLIVHSNYVGDEIGTLKILSAAALYHNSIKINIKQEA